MKKFAFALLIAGVMPTVGCEQKPPAGAPANKPVIEVNAPGADVKVDRDRKEVEVNTPRADVEVKK